jgi:aryl carrier-like protein
MAMQKNEQLKSIIDPMENRQSTYKPHGTELEKQKNYIWSSLKGGSYNYVWRSNFDAPKALVDSESYQGPWVLKYAIPSKDSVIAAMNDKNRAVRLWNEINPDLPKAGLYKNGWVAPYLENTRPATDDEIAKKLVEIYRDTRRITLDAATKGNFLTVKDTEKVVLVDMDMALKRRNSTASINFFKNLNQRFNSYWLDLKLRAAMPKTLEATRNLLYLEDSLTEAEINELCNQGIISIKTIQTLTWLRTHHIKLTFAIINGINVLNDFDVPLTETLFETLSLDSQDKDKFDFDSKASSHNYEMTPKFSL